MSLARLHDDRALAQAVGQGDFHLARHQKRGLQRRFRRESFGNPPNADAENPENDYDRGAKDGYLLLTQAHGS